MAGAKVILDSLSWRKAEANFETSKLYLTRNLTIENTVILLLGNIYRKSLEISCKSDITKYPIALL